MKLDGETVLSRRSVDSKSDQKPVEDSNGAIGSIRLGSENEFESKEQSGGLCKVGIEDQLQYAVSDSTSDDEEKLRDFVSPIRFHRSSLESESLEKDSVFYVDKSVMEPELPELVVCYKENTYHVVKDICIDEGIPSKDKFLFDTDVDEEQLCTLLISEDKHSDIGLQKGDLDTSTEKENIGIGDPVTDVSISSKEKGSRNEVSIEHDMNKDDNHGIINDDMNKLMPIEQDAIEKTGNGASREIFSLGELLSMVAKPKSSNKSMDKAEQMVQRPLETTILTRSHDSEESENANEQASSSSPAESAAEKSQNDSNEETLESHKSDVMSESNRTNEDTLNNCQLETRNFNSSAPLSSQGEENSPNSGAEPFSSQLQYCQGESSFSAAGLITYSGPIAYSGSLSLRSDSSTTSTRSFAFPILQSEWNSSPVRMAKAERRSSSKHGSWRQAILCCRF